MVPEWSSHALRKSIVGALAAIWSLLCIFFIKAPQTTKYLHKKFPRHS